MTRDLRTPALFVARSLLVLVIVDLLGCTSAGPQAGGAPAPCPNIVLIVADDLGYSDLGCYGGEIDTPSLDGLADSGMRYSQFYNAARCCPSRASLLTGLYPHQAGIGHMTYDAGAPGYRGELSPHAATFAQLLKGAGYRTGMCGKWHVTPNTKPDTDQSNWPRQRGFDFFFGTLPGHGSFYDPAGLMRGNQFIKAGKDFFYTDAIADNAVRYITDASKTNQPFLLYVAFTAPHYPLHARQETIDKYDGVFDTGWDVLRQERYQRLVAAGLLDKHHQLPPRDEASIPWADDPNQKWQAHRMQVYAAMIDEMDQGIGRILKALDDAKCADDTIVIFISDNGGSPEGHLNNTIERMGKPWRSSVIPKTTHDGRPVRPGDFSGVPLGGPDTYGSYGLRWASVSNTPFRRHKAWVHEGGIATPMIVRWPDGIKQHGAINHQPAHIIDLTPTFLELAGAEYPDEIGGGKLTPLVGTSLTSTFNGDPLPDRILCWEHEGNRAIRKGRWKLVSEFPGTWKTFYPDQDGEWELYDLANDRLELHNLAKTNRQLVEQLAAEYAKWAMNSMVISWDQLEGRKE